MEFQDPTPDEGETVSGDITLNFSTNDSEDYSIYLDYSDAGDDVATITANGSYTNYILGEDDYATTGQMTIEVSSDEGNASDSVGVTVDNEEPQVENLNLDDRVNSEYGPIQFEVTDQSEITDLDVEVDNGDALDENFDCGDESCSGEVEVDFPDDELEHGNSYDLDIIAEDEYGNELDDYNREFVYDNRFEGDTDVSVSPGPQVFDGSGPDELSVSLDEGDENSEIRVGCRPDSWFDDEWSGFEDVDGSEEFTCDNQPLSFDFSYDLSVELQDEAGNSETVEVGKYLFDQTSPTVGNLSAVVGVFNGDFQLSYDAFDTRDVEGLDVDTIHYQVDDMQYSSDEGEEVSHGEADGSFEVDTEGLEAGEHTVYVWAEDRSGKISTREEFSFDFRPDAEPSAGLSVSDSVSVAAGDSKIVYANVSNTGDLFIGQMELKLESSVFNDSRTLEDLRPGNSTEVMFSVDTDDTDLGKYSMVLSTESPDTSEETEFVVEANSEQDDQINSKYDKYFERYETLEKNVSDLRGSLSGSRKERLESNTSAFFSSMEAAEKAKNNGNLYRVKSELANVEKQFQSASSTFEEVKEKHRKAERNQTIGLFLLLFVGLGGSGVAYVALFSDEYYLDLEALQEEFELLEEPVAKVQEVAEQYEVSAEPLENAVEKFSELLAEEEEEIEEAESQAFQGFT